MKKLSLKNLKLNESNILERNQLKSVFGGYGGYGSSCLEWRSCASDSDCPDENCSRCVDAGLGEKACGSWTAIV